MAAVQASKRRATHHNEDLLTRAENAVRPPVTGALQGLREYAQENPEAAALWCLGLGFVLGWRLKPW